MGWALLLVIAYLPIFYKMNMRIREVERKNEALEAKINELQSQQKKRNDPRIEGHFSIHAIVPFPTSRKSSALCR